MAITFLTVSFKDKDAAKALGARWDNAQRQWFVPEGRELSPFSQWLPAGLDAGLSLAPTSIELAPFTNSSASLSVSGKKGVSLSQLLAGVSQAVAQAYRAGVWTLVEVVELRAKNGHVFIGVSERDAHGSVLAKTSAVIWQSTANTILSEFERTTGAQLAPGIKLLVRARPVFKPLHGFTLEIDAIDSEYTLGDLEARKREIRERLQAEGVFAANKMLPAPWDFSAVLVVAPEGGAGLGDFQAEANRLDKFGVCRFTYAYSRFQGEGAAKAICDALQAEMKAWNSRNAMPPDAVVIIRGGGAVNDMAWLNDYDLARYICDLPIPVWTGIGHERDNTVLDEVAHTRFDTPSKVIAGIEKLISSRVFETQANFEQIANLAARATQSARAMVGTLDMTVKVEALRHLAQGKQEAVELLSGIRMDAMQGIRSASEQSRDALQWVKSEAATLLAQAKRDVPAFWGQISSDAKHALQTISVQSEVLMGNVLERAQRDAMQARQTADDALDVVSTTARLLVREGATRSEALMREIAGQGLEKTLNRGFAIVRNQGGAPLTRAAQATEDAAIEIQFSDGRVSAVTGKQL
ncbi:MAG: exodeoxyribonuclease VII large subunit [Rhodoferax sp.]|uniref:exodeoxyribonuclease VII large subunit n=1 Tax=Rhodoferax sp. TaxID=50421 RepID=UPI0017ED4FED|nr:exodeoxyribonuclease VII large subunit [Rhodoferax sp.]NMM20942.1 exodeoxyribonuclease VII large subunit [Rhodoferax sp.]